MHHSCTARHLLCEISSRLTITNPTWYIQGYTSIWYVHTWFVLVCTLFTSTNHFPSGPISIAMLASLCFAHNLFLLSSILVPHQGRVLVYTCIYHVQTAHIHFQAVLSYAMIQTCIYMAYTFTVLYIHCNNMYIHVYTLYRQLIYIFKHSCRMLGDRNLPFCTYWAHTRCLGCSGVCQFVYTGHRQQYRLLILSIYNFDIL